MSPYRPVQPAAVTLSLAMVSGGPSFAQQQAGPEPATASAKQAFSKFIEQFRHA